MSMKLPAMCDQNLHHTLDKIVAKDIPTVVCIASFTVGSVVVSVF